MTELENDIELSPENLLTTKRQGKYYRINREKGQMKKSKHVILAVTLTTIILTSMIAIANSWLGYIKPPFTDYVPSGMPDFDQKVPIYGQGITWCGPVATANSLWWLDSKYESIVFPAPVAPPAISDHFGLVTSYNPLWDDHDPQNVPLLVQNLAFCMDTDGIRTGDGHKGTRLRDMQPGIQRYLNQQGMTRLFEVHNASLPLFPWIENEVEICQDVELFLEFKQEVMPGVWQNLTSNPSLENGHFVTCAGVNSTTFELLISDPYQDAFEAGTAPRGGRSPVIHPYPHGPVQHDNTTYVSQDAYPVATYPIPNPYGQFVSELVGYLQTMGYPPTFHAFIRAAVSTSPKEMPEWQGYVKPAFKDYAPSGMPDFDQKQDQWGPGPGTYTWCGPVATANSLWWLDSKYESIVFPAPVAPPAISDHFSLVTSYNPAWDDHDSQNVDPLVRDLALLMDTDGIRTHDGHTGTRWQDMEAGIKQYLIQQGVAGLFEVHNSTFPIFPWIESEVERCQDVELFLEFWRFTGSWQKLYDNPSLEAGHFVTCAGVNSTSSELLVSDPYQDAFEAGTNPKGRSPVLHGYPHPSQLHNDAQFVSQDAYGVAPWTVPPPSPYPNPVWELLGYLQTMGYDPSWHTFIVAAVATSPAGIHDVAVTNVTTSKYGCQPMETVGKGMTCRINATVENQGTFGEIFNVTAHANATKIGSKQITLASGSSTVVTFGWNTTGYAFGNYTISAVADTVPGETDTGDNTFTDGKIHVGLIGDVNGDKKVDLKDVYAVGKAFGTTRHGPNPPGRVYSPNLDINDDDKIDLKDYYATTKNFGKTET